MPGQCAHPILHGEEGGREGRGGKKTRKSTCGFHAHSKRNPPSLPPSLPQDGKLLKRLGKRGLVLDGSFRLSKKELSEGGREGGGGMVLMMDHRKDPAFQMEGGEEGGREGGREKKTRRKGRENVRIYPTFFVIPSLPPSLPSLFSGPTDFVTLTSPSRIKVRMEGREEQGGGRERGGGGKGERK